MANFSSDVDSLTSKLQSTTLPRECGVSFSGQSLKLNNAQDAQVIADEIKKTDVVEYLNMEGNSLGVDAAKEIAKALETRKEFKKALWKDMFTSRLKTEIPIALKHLCGSLMLAGARLEVLDLSDNASGPIGVEGFEDFLRSPSCYSLRELRLNNMGLGVTGAKKLASALLDLYNNSKNAGETLRLEVFIAGRNRLENPGATALAQVFQKIGTLKEISIPQNGIYHPGINALSEAFNENLSLQVINLNDNTVTEKGAKFLSKVLGKLSSLKTLDLGDCLLRSEGAIAVAQALSDLRQLETLNLSFNEIRGETGTRVLESLAPLAPCLSSLNLDGNMFGPALADNLASRARSLSLPLASLSEDEGDDGEDEEDVEDEQEDDDDEEDEEDEDTESDQPYHIDEDYEEEDEEETDGEITVLGMNSGVSPMRASANMAVTTGPFTPNFASLLQQKQPQGNFVVNFLSNPTKENFLLISDPKANAIIDDIKTRVLDAERHCEELIHSVVLVAGLHSCPEKQVKEIIMRTSISIFQEITSLSERNKTTHVINNRLPVHFGYLKDEETNKKKSVHERDSCLRVLHAAIDSKCLPQQTINIITCIETNPIKV